MTTAPDELSAARRAHRRRLRPWSAGGRRSSAGRTAGRQPGARREVGGRRAAVGRAGRGGSRGAGVPARREEGGAASDGAASLTVAARDAAAVADQFAGPRRDHARARAQPARPALHRPSGAGARAARRPVRRRRLGHQPGDGHLRDGPVGDAPWSWPWSRSWARPSAGLPTPSPGRSRTAGPSPT